MLDELDKIEKRTYMKTLKTRTLGHATITLHSTVIMSGEYWKEVIASEIFWCILIGQNMESSSRFVERMLVVFS